MVVPEGKGFVSYEVTDRGLEVDFSIGERIEARNQAKLRNKVYYAMTLSPKDQDQTVDFSWMEKIKIKAYVVGVKAETFRMHVNNQVPGVTVENDQISRMFNEVTFRLTSEPQTLELERQHFRVPVWWVERYQVPLDKAHASFGKTEFVQFFAISNKKAKDYKLVIEELTVSGHWIPTVILYRSLLLLWLVLAFGAVIEKSLRLRRTAQLAREREESLKALNESLRCQTDEFAQIAMRDQLTGVFSRYGFGLHVNQAKELADETETPLSLILLDIDHFKEINDTQGHNVGDKVLSDLGALLAAENLETETIGRWGGEEFVVVCSFLDVEQAWLRAEELRRQVERQLDITCSLGVCSFGPDEEFLTALAGADNALYQAKSTGRNRSQIYLPLDAASQGPKQTVVPSN